MAGDSYSIEPGTVTKQYVDAAVAAAGGGSSAPLLPFDPALEASLVGAGESLLSAGYTLGLAFLPLKSGLSCTGVRTYWGAGAATLKFSLYDKDGTRVKTKTQAVTGPGLVEVTFDAAQALTAGQAYRAAVYCATTGTASYQGNLPTGAAPTGVQRNGTVAVFDCCSQSSDASPTITSGWVYLFPVSPILVQA